ncbi:unnamed protein product, partial [Laminaria digitata]
YIRGSITVSSRRTYASGFRSWRIFRSLAGHSSPYINEKDSGFVKVMALVEFAAWCCAAEGNQPSTIRSKLSAVQYFHTTDVGVELPIDSTLVQRQLQGMKRAHTEAGVGKRVRLPLTLNIL